jgi:hypothetical protein
MAAPHTVPKDTFIAILHRAGFTAEVIDEIASQVPDPIDLDRDSTLLLRLGISRDLLSDRLGYSP